MSTPALSFKLGRFTVSLQTFQDFRLDGGAMFGSVPKTLWNKLLPADELNRIPLVTRSLVISDNNRTILVDVGFGERWSEKHRAIYQVQPRESSCFHDVTDIILTHLHFDHAAGLANGLESDVLSPRFAQATVYVSSENLANARKPHSKERASYLPLTLEALSLHQVKETAPSQEVFQGIFLHQAHGHTSGLQWIEIRDNDQTLLFPSDVIPTSHHLHPAFHMGYDMCAQTALEEKNSLIEYALQRDAFIVFQHDPAVELARLVRDESGRVVARSAYPDSLE